MRALIGRLIVLGAVLLPVETSGVQDSKFVPLGPPIVTKQVVLETIDRLMVQHMYLPPVQWHPELPLKRQPDVPKTLPMDTQILTIASRSADPAIRAAFVRGLGRLERPADVGTIAPYLADSNTNVRIEAANALAQVLHFHDVPGELQAADLAATALTQQLTVESDPRARAEMLEAIGEPRYLPATARKVEDLLVSETYKVPRADLPAVGSPFIGTLRGLEALVRSDRTYQVAPKTRARLRQLAVPSLDFSGGPYLPALQALVTLRDEDPPTVRAAIDYHCPRSQIECGSELRRLGLQLVSDPSSFTSSIRMALDDPVEAVRIEALRAATRDNAPVKSCSPFQEALTDKSVFVALEALTLMDTKCDEHEAVAGRLEALARDLGDPTKSDAWRLPAGALVALARFSPAAAREIAEKIAATHPRWQVRQAAARVALAVHDEPLALKLSDDAEPNVQTEALSGLYRMKSPSLAHAAIHALESSDHELVLMAASVLKTANDGEASAPALVSALARLSGDQHPLPDITRTGPPGNATSRETRLELIARIAQFVPPTDNLDAIVRPLTALLDDFDPVVQSAAADTLASLTGTRPEFKANLPYGLPVYHDTRISRRTQLQIPGQSADPLDFSTQCFAGTMDEGERFIITANGAEAPYTVTAFKKLVDAGYYNGLTFHRVILDDFIEGGSPGGNFYSGTDFLRDEMGLLRHVPGAIALSRHDRNTGNMQFFVDEVPNPGLNHEFTVFGQFAWIAPPPYEKLAAGEKIAQLRCADCRTGAVTCGKAGK